MELGALVCTPRNPQCKICPVKKFCVAFKENRTVELPNLGKRETATARRFVAFVIERNGKFLVRQRPAEVVNAHLWEFPNVEVNGARLDMPRIFKSEFGDVPEKLSPLATVKHSITRYRITLEAFLVRPDKICRRNPTASGKLRRRCRRWLSPPPIKNSPALPRKVSCQTDDLLRLQRHRARDARGARSLAERHRENRRQSVVHAPGRHAREHRARRRARKARGVSRLPSARHHLDQRRDRGEQHGHAPFRQNARRAGRDLDFRHRTSVRSRFGETLFWQAREIDSRHARRRGGRGLDHDGNGRQTSRPRRRDGREQRDRRHPAVARNPRDLPGLRSSVFHRRRAVHRQDAVERIWANAITSAARRTNSAGRAAWAF